MSIFVKEGGALILVQRFLLTVHSLLRVLRPHRVLSPASHTLKVGFLVIHEGVALDKQNGLKEV